MSLDIDMQEKDGYFHVKLSGSFTVEEALPLFEKMILFSTATRQTNVLFDCRDMNAGMTLEDIFAYSVKSTEIVKDYIEAGNFKGLKSAYLLYKDFPNLDKIVESEEISISRDFILTSDYDEAVKWLQSLE